MVSVLRYIANLYTSQTRHRFTLLFIGLWSASRLFMCFFVRLSMTNETSLILYLKTAVKVYLVLFDIVWLLSLAIWFVFMALKVCMCVVGPDGTVLYRQPQKGLCVKKVSHHLTYTHKNTHTDCPWVYFLQVLRLLAFGIIKGWPFWGEAEMSPRPLHWRADSPHRGPWHASSGFTPS